MNFLLVDPPHRIWEFLRAWVPSPGCLQLAAYIENDFDFEFLDCTIQQNPWRDLEEKVKTLQPDVIGISNICTCFLNNTMDAARLVKETNQDSIVLVGGGQPSLMPEELLRKCSSIDYICVGEGEITLHEFLSAIEKKQDIKQIKGIAYLNAKDEFIFTGERPLIADLDTLPMPAYHLYNMEHPYVGLPSEGDRAFMVNFARGCSYDCSFCSEAVFWHNKWRTRSPEKIGEELELLKETYNRDIFYVGDNIFNLTREKSEGFIKEMIARKTGQNFWLQSRSNLIIRDQDLMDGFREAGVYQFMLGIEHSKQSILDGVSKRITSDENEEAMRILKAHGFMVMATLIIGLWEETAQDRLDLMNFLRPYVDHLGLNVITPYPGTGYYKEMKRLGRIKTDDYSQYDQIQAIMPTREEPDRNKVTEEHLSIMRKYYWQPKEVLKTFFSRNKILRHHHKHFLGIGITAFKHEVFGAPMWQQETFQEFEEYMKERG